MSNQPKIPAPTIEAEVVIHALSNRTLQIGIPDNLDLAMDMLLAAMNNLHQARKKKDKPLIEPVGLGAAAMDVMNDGRAR